MGIKFQKEFYNQIFHNCTIKKYGNGTATPTGNRSVSNPKGQALPYGNLFSSTWQSVSLSRFHLRPVTRYL